MIPRARRLEALVAAKRELHPELARPLTWARLGAVCRREEIHLLLAPLPQQQPAQLVPFFGGWTILVSDECTPRDRVRLAAHELGHLWTHHDPLHERWELVYQLDEPAPGSGAEREADGVAFLLIEGLAHFPPRKPRAVVLAVAARIPDPYTSPPVLTITRREPRYGGRPQMSIRLDAALRRAKQAPSGPYIAPARSAAG